MDGEARYDCALAAATLILDMLKEKPAASPTERLSLTAYAILEAIYAAELLVGGFKAQPSEN